MRDHSAVGRPFSRIRSHCVSQLRPAVRRALPELLPAVDGQLQQSVRRCHRFVAPAGGPVHLVDPVTVPELASQDAEVPVCDLPVHGVLRYRVPANGIAPEVAIPRALLVRSLAEGRVTYGAAGGHGPQRRPELSSNAAVKRSCFVHGPVWGAWTDAGMTDPPCIRHGRWRVGR